MKSLPEVIDFLKNGSSEKIFTIDLDKAFEEYSLYEDDFSGSQRAGTCKEGAGGRSGRRTQCFNGRPSGFRKNNAFKKASHNTSKDDI